jgi:hypothetical protein
MSQSRIFCASNRQVRVELHLGHGSRFWLELESA